MKTSKAYYYQGKFKYLEGDKWPVDYCSKCAKIPRGCKCECDERYQESLTSALKEAIDFEDQDNIEEIVREELGPDLWNRPLQEGLYTIPEQEIEKVWITVHKETPIPETQDDLHTSIYESQREVTQYPKHIQVARIKESGKSKYTLNKHEHGDKIIEP